jgi:hypothetical protein
MIWVKIMDLKNMHTFMNIIVLNSENKSFDNNFRQILKQRCPLIGLKVLLLFHVIQMLLNPQIALTALLLKHV